MSVNQEEPRAEAPIEASPPGVQQAGVQQARVQQSGVQQSGAGRSRPQPAESTALAQAELAGVPVGGGEALELTLLPAAVERSQVAAWLELLRPRVAAMVFLTALVGGVLAGPLVLALEAAIYVTLVTGAASVLNQVLERDTDARMQRTAARPLVVGQIAVRDAILFAFGLAVAGTVGLLLSFQLLSAFLSLATLLVYVAIYTPLKRVSTLNTVVGAVAGAAPPLLGYVAVAGSTGPWAWALFGVLFAWEFPHFMAIAWLYRADYARAGLHMVPALTGSEGQAGKQAIAYASALVPVALLPFTAGMVGWSYALVASLASGAYLAASISFARCECRVRARRLLLVSLVYLPLLYLSILVDPLVS